MPIQATAVIAEWIGVDLLHAYMLRADGVLVEVHRSSRGAMWSPPRDVGKLHRSVPEIEQLLQELTLPLD